MKMIGIKRLWYGDPIAEAITADNAATLIPQLIGAATEVRNVHGDTWGYTQDDHTITDYMNAITGKPYYRDIGTEGLKTITFTVGEYELQMKADLQGGTVDSGVWASPDMPEIIYKSIIALTKTGNYVIFTNASISGKVDVQEKALGLGLAAVASDNETADVADEYWIDTSKTQITLDSK